eukprot:SAG22_NODE_15130_length_356_cov_0.801556_1_plen_69_part_01
MHDCSYEALYQEVFDDGGLGVASFPPANRPDDDGDDYDGDNDDGVGTAKWEAWKTLGVSDLCQLVPTSF